MARNCKLAKTNVGCLNILNKKLCYWRGTARRALLVNLCYVSRGMGVRKVSTTKVIFKVIQGHWQWCHSIGHIQFPINVPLQLCLYLAR